MNQSKTHRKASSLSFPLTLRGLILLTLAIYFIVGPVRLNFDIIAAGFASCTLAALALFLGLAFLSKRRLRKSLSITLSYDSQSEIKQTDFAGEAITILAKISGVTIAPFFELRIRYIFKQIGIETRTHSLDPSCPKQTFISEAVIFPHRGKWKIDGISLELVDRLGFTKMRLPFLNLDHEFIIKPKPYHCPRWPVLASTIRVDDQIHHPVERKGDLYDLKQYHPADGARKIVWKLFAKSGQLFSRYPEPAYSPEGKVAFFCLAKKMDDKLASESIAYLEELDNLDIEIMFATLSSELKIVTNFESAINLIIEEAWNSEATNIGSVEKALKALVLEAKGGNNDRTIQNIILAISENSLQDPSYRQTIEACQLLLSQEGIRSSIFMSSSSDGSSISNTKVLKSSLSSGIKQLFLEVPHQERANKNHKNAQAFISTLNPANSDLEWS